MYDYGKKLHIACTLTQVGSSGKYQHLGGALGNSPDLMLVFPCTPLLLSRYRYNPMKVLHIPKFPSTHYVLSPELLWNGMATVYGHIRMFLVLYYDHSVWPYP